MPGSQGDGLVWERTTRAATLALLTLVVAYTAWYLLRYSDFSNDDLDNFVLMRSTGFWTFLQIPNEVHYVPLHRLLTWIAYHIRPMSFGVAVAMLMAFHIGTLSYLGASLRPLHAQKSGGLLICAYASSGLVIYGLSWWAHAEHRAPYVFFDMCAIGHYLLWLRNGRTRHLWVAGVAFALAFGFYEKAILIPLHMLVIGYLMQESRFRECRGRCAWPPVLLALVSGIYVVAYLLFHPGSAGSTLSQAVRGDLEFLKVLFAGASGLGVEVARDIPIHGWSWQLVTLIIAALLMFAWSLWRGRGSWKVLLAMVLVLLADNLPIAMSNRIFVFGLGTTHFYRFGYEELHVIALFLGIWWARAAIEPVTSCARKLSWATGFVAVMAFAVMNASNLRESRHATFSGLWLMGKSHGYLSNLRQDLAQLPTTSPAFENSATPGYLSIARFTPDTRTLLPLFVPSVRFSDGYAPHYKVLDSGHIVYIQ